jgi:hypothetical protein
MSSIWRTNERHACAFEAPLDITLKRNGRGADDSGAVLTTDRLKP